MPVPRLPRRPCRSCGTEVKRAQDTYCDNRCQQDFQYREYIARWLAGQESGNKGESVSKYVRRHLHEKHGEKCEECGWGKRHPVTGLVPLTVEHVDGNAENTVESNLRLLCPNCHSLTPTYGNLNRGRGRKARRLKRQSAGVAQR